MNDVAKAFFHKVLEKTASSLTQTGREKVIIEVIDHLFAHPWVDEEVQCSMITNIANCLDIEVPKEYKYED